jgi:hypothetical protein
MIRDQHQAIKKAIDKYTKEATKSPQAARDALVKEGIYLSSGKLAPKFAEPREKPIVKK